VRAARRTFTTYETRLSHPIAVARITELQLQHLQHLQHFAFGDCAAHGEMSPTGASNPDGTDAIAAR
jgi:hypothetical protein